MTVIIDISDISTRVRVLCVKTDAFTMLYKVIVTSSVYPLCKQNDSFRGGPKFITVNHENRTCQVHSLVDMEVIGLWMKLSVLFSHLEANADMMLHVYEHGVSCHMSPDEGKRLAVSSVNIITSVKVCICQVSL